MSREERPYFDSLTRASRRVLTTIGLEPHRRRAESLVVMVMSHHVRPVPRRRTRPAPGPHLMTPATPRAVVVAVADT